MAKNQKRKSLASMAGGKLVAFDEAIQSRLRMNPDKWVENHNNSEGGILGSANRFGNLVMHAANPKADVPKPPPIKAEPIAVKSTRPEACPAN